MQCWGLRLLMRNQRLTKWSWPIPINHASVGAGSVCYGLWCFALCQLVWASGHLGIWELVCLWVGVGVVAGTISINYGYEMIHQKPRVERWIADILLAMVLYSHFFRGHHRYIGTLRDPVAARYNESFFGSSQKSGAGRRCIATKSRIGRPVIRHKTRDPIE